MTATTALTRVLRLLLPAALALAAAACAKRQDEFFLQKSFIMGVPAQVKVYGADEASGKLIADAVFKEWNRISGDFSYTDPYSMTSVVNKKAYGEWVKVNDEFLFLLRLSLDYYRLTDGAFDITFAPLWPIWQEAASTRKMPSKEEIAKALANMGSGYVQVDAARRMVRFARPVQINLGGILRGYCFVRAARMLREMNPPYPVELWLGSNMLAYGKRDWKYPVTDPFNEDKTFGTFRFGQGVMLSSSGREHFVQIEGKLYSHILDLKTGYPLPDFSSLVVYFPRLESENYMSSAMLAVVGREKAFALLSRMKGTAAVWIDGSGKETVLTNPDSGAAWEKTRKLF
ncbi:MAG: FAD:protein FMN transferase [Elusimicrobia bacterium]|nr:FAD:protein FMN transferase [Elusimicrobiota bacterium]